MTESDESLLIHMGGLGDICLSESAFLTISLHCKGPIRAVGNARVLELFSAYFTRVESIDRREWAYLFSDSSPGPSWKRIIFFGKDREGSFRTRLSGLTHDLIFIDLYPDGMSIPVEQHQLAQLAAYGMKPTAAAFPERWTDRIILYAEEGFEKHKWSPENFVRVQEGLAAQGLNSVFVTPPELLLPGVPTLSFDGLPEIAAFLSKGGFFFSNDSGMAHLAARCGLFPTTLFWEADPDIWRPKGSRVVRCKGEGPSIQEAIELIVEEMRERAKEKP
jgi:ADP-heptose:LPS heptosyltransferase